MNENSESVQKPFTYSRNVFIYSGSPSNGANTLSNYLAIRKIRTRSSNFRGDKSKTVINWGSSSLPREALECNVLNKAEVIGVVAHKLNTFRELEKLGVQIPEFSTSIEEARGWLKQGSVVVREILSGHSGAGIVILDDLKMFEAYDHSRAKLYVRYVKKAEEYRVHVAFGEVIDIQRKAKPSSLSITSVNYKVRTHSNGFVFVREGVKLPEKVREMCLHAVHGIGLDFGAVDLVYNKYYNTYTILEINSAPGLQATTLRNYGAAFSKVLGLTITDVVSAREDEYMEEDPEFDYEGRSLDLSPYYEIEDPSRLIRSPFTLANLTSAGMEAGTIRSSRSLFDDNL